MTSHTRPWKEKQFAELKALASQYPVIAVADVDMYPAALFQKVRKKLSGKAIVRVSKTRIIKRVFADDPKTKGLVDVASGNCAVIFTEMNPFELFSFLKKNKGKVLAKAGAITDEDIMIPAGDTGLPPGPALSDLKAAGLKVAVQGPTITIMSDKVVTKAGEAVSAVVAGTLSKLNIKPFKVGLKLVSALENSQLFDAGVLDIDTEKVFADFVSAHRKAFNLAFNATIFTSETTELLVVKSYRDAKAVCLEANILNSATVGDLLAKADRQAKAIKPMIKEEAPVSEGKKEEVPTGEKAEEETPAEEVKEQASEEKKEEAIEEAPAQNAEVKKENDA